MRVALLCLLICLPWETLSAQSVSTPTARQRIIDALKNDIAQQARDLDEARKHAADADANSARLNTELATAQQQVDQVAKERDGFRVYGDDQHEKVMASAVTIQKQKAALLRRDILLGVIALLLAAYTFAKFYLRVPFL